MRLASIGPLVMLLVGAGFFVMMAASILTGQGDSEYDAIMGMLCANTALILAVLLNQNGRRS